MECLSVVSFIINDFYKSPSWIYMYRLFTFFSDTFRGPGIVHALPALIVLVAVGSRYARSEWVNEIRNNARRKMHFITYVLSHVFVLSVLINLMLVVSLAVQNFIYCCVSSYFFKSDRVTRTVPSQLWEKPSGQGCWFGSNAMGFLISLSLALVVCSMILWHVLVESYQNRTQLMSDFEAWRCSVGSKIRQMKVAELVPNIIIRRFVRQQLANDGFHLCDYENN